MVVGDLHIGIETDFALGGVKVPSGTPAMVGRLKALQARTRSRRLVIAGDLKHSTKEISPQETVEVPRALGEMAQAFEEVIVVPGNHDGRIEDLFPRGEQRIAVAPAGGFLSRGGLLVVHGHAWPDPRLARKAKVVAMAHSHTAVALEDPLGRVSKESCWVRAHVNPEKWLERMGSKGYPEIVMMPPFNDLCTGVPVNVAGGLGPLIRDGCVDLERGEVYLLDGVHLGRVRDLALGLEPKKLRALTRGVSEDL